MPGSPPTTTRLGLPRYAQTDAAQFSPQVNAIVDALDPITARTDDTRFTNARTPTAHATTHQPGGSDAMAVDAAAATASLRTLGTGANQAAAGNDVRLRGGDFASVSGLPILDVGLANQIRAGRQLTVADFTSLGLTQPIGLFNLSDLTNLGSDTTALANKGTVTFAAGINGAATTAAQFTGSTAQVLYIAGPATNYQIKTGSLGCWFRTAKRGVVQTLIGKWSSVAATRTFVTYVDSGNFVGVQATDGTVVFALNAVSDVADDRWHFVVHTHDGTTLRTYIDGVLEAAGTLATALNSSASAPFNIGGWGADAGTAANSPHYGRIDEAFVTADVLTEDQIRGLYAAKLTHTLGVAPTAVRLNVHRKRKGAPLVVGDFTTTPIRLYNFTAADLAGAGSDTSGNRLLTNNGTAVSVAGADGTPAAAFSFAGAQSLGATDAGLPNLLTQRSYGCWFKTATTGTTMAVMGWGTVSTADARLFINSSGQLCSVSGADLLQVGYYTDGQWHFAVTVEDNTAGDGLRRKYYADGRLLAGSTTLNTLTLVGANGFRLGANPGAAGGAPFTGQIDGAFVTGYALTPADVATLYAKGSQDLGVSPKNPGDHVERMSSTDLLWIGDTLESQHTIDLGVMA